MNLKQLFLLAFALTLPLAGACATLITTNTALAPGDTTYEGADLIVSNCTLTVNGPHGFSSLLLTSNATLTCDAISTGLVVTVTGDFTVSTNCAVTVTGKGFQGTGGTGLGPGGAGGTRSDGGGGGAGGGYGGPGGRSEPGYAGGSAYGSLTAPVDWGSAGGAGFAGNGGAGGGAIRLIVGQTLRVEGAIEANGISGAVFGWGAAGGGAGGSIWITAQTLTGTGRLSANAGNGAIVSEEDSGGGGGGRIALYFETNTFAGALSAQGGSGYVAGGAGTIFSKSPAQSYGDLLLDNGGNAGARTPLAAGSWSLDSLSSKGRARLEVTTNVVLTLTAPVLTLLTNGEVIIGGQVLCGSQAGGKFTRLEALNGGALTLQGGARLSCEEMRATSGGTVVLSTNIALACDRMEVLASGTLLTDGPASFGAMHVGTNGLVSYTLGQGSNVTVSVATDLVVDLGGAISVSGKGFQGTGGTGLGPGGAGGTRSDGGGGGAGGGYGGQGGRSEPGYAGGSAYGSVTAPVDWGSAGGAGYGGNGGAGGGAVRLIVGQTLQVDGLIGADGINGAVAGWGAAGGGAGGSIWITAQTLTGTGRLSASAGNGAIVSEEDSGGGGGGRVALYFETNTFTGALAAQGGSGYVAGGAGTIFSKSTVQSYGDLLLDNGGNAGARTPLAAGSWALDSLSCKGRARIEVPTNVVLTLTAPVLTLLTNGEVIIGGQVLCGSQAGGKFTRLEAVNGGVLTLQAGAQLSCEEARITSGGALVLSTNVTLACDRMEVLASGTLLTDGPASFGTMHVGTNGLVSYTLGQGSNVTVSVTNDLVVDLGGAFSVSGKGFQGTSGTGLGPGGGGGARADSAGGAGGSYAGPGGQGQSSYTPGPVYGSVTAPVDWGSAGGAGYPGNGGAGGGAIRLSVGQTLQVDGLIAADGISGAAHSWGGAGGGAGGSIWITAQTLTGTGRVSASAGNGAIVSEEDSGGGGGGRIALYFETNTFAGALSAQGGSGYVAGGAGTIFSKAPAQSYGDLLLDNGGNAGARTPLAAGSWVLDSLTSKGRARIEVPTNVVLTLTAPVLTLLTNGEVIIGGQVLCGSQAGGKFTRVEAVNGGVLTLQGGAQLASEELRTSSGGTLVLSTNISLACDRMEVLAGGTLLTDGPASFGAMHIGTNGLVSYTLGQGSNVAVSVATDLVVDVGGAISVTGKGFQGTGGTGLGPGGGGGARADSAGGAGGSYGGAGGQGQSGYTPGLVYGSEAAPVDWGSAGGAGFAGNGGAGGGAIRLSVGHALQVDGVIEADGLSGAAHSWGASGGGAGGSIWITAEMLAGIGRISAKGGNGAVVSEEDSGGGGGGRIAVSFDNYAFTGVIYVNGGTGNQSGQPGTYYIIPHESALPALNEMVQGILQTPYSVDQWTFTAAAGVVIRLDSISTSVPGVAFDLQGPGGWIGFSGLTSQSSLITLPTNGTYSLVVRGTGGAGDKAYVCRLQKMVPTNTVPTMTVLQPGTRGGAFITVTCSSLLTNLQFALTYPVGPITQLLCDSIASPLAAGHLSIAAPGLAWVTLSALPGQGIQGTQVVAQLSYEVPAGQPSAFVSLVASDIEAATSNGQPPGRVRVGVSRIVVLAREPLLEAARGAQSQPVVQLYSHPGTNYLILTHTNLNGLAPWQDTGRITPTNQIQALDGVSVDGPVRFYRVREDSAP